MTLCFSHLKSMTTCLLAFGAVVLLASGEARGEFHPSSLGTLSVSPFDTYYDGSDGLLFSAVPLPTRATALQFSVTGSMATVPPQPFLITSPDGFGPTGFAIDGTNVRFNGTYKGTPVGATTGIDPAVFGVFFSPNFSGTPQDSADYRWHGGIGPDLRALSSYSPSVNQPFFIGDGLDQDNVYGAVPQGNPQTFNIPVGATELLLGLGADIQLNDNSGSGYSAKAFDNSPNGPIVPEPASITLMGLGMASMGGWLRRRKAA